MKTSRLTPLGLLAVVAIGCAEFRAPSDWFGEREVPRASLKNPVDRIVAIWQPTEGRGMNGLPSRGFGGQIMFFPVKGETPVAVDGDVRIYVFDDQGTLEQQTKPIHQFDFKNGGWDAQLVHGALGPAYQVFIPYTRKGSHQAKCSLRLRLQPAHGAAIYSDVVNVTLPGSKPEDSPTSPNLANAPTPSPSRTETIQLVDAERVEQPAVDRIARLERVMASLAENRGKVPASGSRTGVDAPIHAVRTNNVVRTEPNPGVVDGPSTTWERSFADAEGSSDGGRRKRYRLKGTSTPGNSPHGSLHSTAPASPPPAKVSLELQDATPWTPPGTNEASDRVP